MIDTLILTESEVQWVNNYHRETFEKISGRMEGDALKWLKDVTSPI